MHDPLVDVQIAQTGTQLHEDAPDGLLANAVFLLRLGEDEVCETVAV